MLIDGDELALIDLREEQTFSERHLLHARCVPLSRIELRISQLVPRPGTRIVLCDEADGFAERAARTLARLGYTDVTILDGGVSAWAAAGFEVFSGVNVPSKAFGEFVEHVDGTPSISAQELDGLLRARTDMVVLDSRPFDEYARVSIPTGINVPGAELVLRVHDLAPSPETLVVVNCAGRTRSIIGAQSLINAGIPNKVVALRNGTMGWTLAGLSCEAGQRRLAPTPSPEGLARAQAAAAAVARRFGVECIDFATLERWRAEERTLYVFDVRDPSEYEAGHVPGAVSAPGGQLVQATDQYVGTLRSRIVLVDDKQVRALMTASWLRQMGWREVFVLPESGTETGQPAATVPWMLDHPELRISPAALARMMETGEATIVDLSLSRDYLRGHIPGAWFAIRAQLNQALAAIAPQGTLVITSEDGALAALAAPEDCGMTAVPIRYLAGGNAAWRAAGHTMTTAVPKFASKPVDVWLKPYERTADVAVAMAAYLEWETDLLPRIERDGTISFEQFR